MSQSAPGIGQLFQSAHEAGDLTAASLQALQVVDLGAQMQDALGMPALDVQAAEVLLVTVLIDDSGSIRFVAGNSEAVRNGHNGLLDALKGSKQDDSILIQCRYLNGKVLYPFCPIAQAIQMDDSNYNPTGGTPLYFATAATLGTVIAKSQEFADNGVPVRTATLIVTDGNDEDQSQRMTISKVNTLVTDMLRRETNIVAAMGIADGALDFTLIFKAMGIPDQWILTPQNTPHDIRQAFGTFSKSAVRMSQSAQSFSQTAMGGFASP